MNNINLIIGGVDISEYVETDSYSARKAYEKSESFKNHDGKNIVSLKGFHYEISVKLELVPDAVMRKLTAALDSDIIPVTFTDPHSDAPDGCTTAAFLRGDSTGGEIACQLDDGFRWDLSISLDSEFVPAGGGL